MLLDTASSSDTLPVASLGLAGLLLVVALVTPAEQRDLTRLDGWSGFVSYMASHPDLRVPPDCAGLLSGGGDIDPREYGRSDVLELVDEVRPERDRINATCEVDETYIGGREEGRTGGRRRSEVKAIVVGAAEVRGSATGRIRLAVVPDFSAESLVGFVGRSVEPGNAILTDGWGGYCPLSESGYIHRPKTQGSRRNASEHLPRMHRVFGNLKTWLDGTHHGVSGKHLPYYLDEFVFRFNRRKTPMAAFQTLLGLSSSHEPTTYKMLYAAERSG